MRTNKPTRKQIADAAQAAAMLFAERQWKWHGVGIPGRERLEVEMLRLIASLGDDVSEASFGRITASLYKEEDGNAYYRLRLELL